MIFLYFYKIIRLSSLFWCFRLWLLRREIGLRLLLAVRPFLEDSFGLAWVVPLR